MEVQFFQTSVSFQYNMKTNLFTFSSRKEGSIQLRDKGHGVSCGPIDNLCENLLKTCYIFDSVFLRAATGCPSGIRIRQTHSLGQPAEEGLYPKHSSMSACPLSTHWIFWEENKQRCFSLKKKKELARPSHIQLEGGTQDNLFGK